MICYCCVCCLGSIVGGVSEYISFYYCVHILVLDIGMSYPEGVMAGSF